MSSWIRKNQNADPATLEAALEVGLIPGGHWHEQSIGTNAIGTALAAGEPVQVHGAERVGRPTETARLS